MKKRNLLFFTAAAILSVCSCSKTDEIDDVTPVHVEDRVIDTKVILDNVWTESSFGAKNTGNPFFVCYLFNSDGDCLRTRGNNMSNNMQTIFEEATSAGTYSIYGITNWYEGEFPMSSTSTIDLDTELSLYENRDISLGRTTFSIVDGTMDYNVEVRVNHIMAKLMVEIKSVPSHISAISIELPNQANKFKFDGTILGNNQSQTLRLTKSTTPNENGSYDWTLAETIVFPSATDATAMPIKVTATSTYATIEPINTTTTTLCSSGTRKRLTATWEAFYNTTTVTVNPWTDIVEDGTFEL